MDCDAVERALVAYQFGIVEAGDRRAIEEHLVGCAACLRDFLTLKREIETADARPSRAAHERLRHAVAREIGAVPSRSARSWWERPLALGLAGVTLVGAIFAVHALASSPGAAPRELPARAMPL